MPQVLTSQGRSLFPPQQIDEVRLAELVNRYRTGHELRIGEHKLLLHALPTARPDLVHKKNELRFANRPEHLLCCRRQDSVIAALVAANLTEHLADYPAPLSLLAFLHKTLPPFHFRRDAYGVTFGKPFEASGNPPARKWLLEYFDSLPGSEQAPLLMQHLRSRPCLLECPPENPLQTRLFSLLVSPSGTPLHGPVLEELAALATASAEIPLKLRPILQALPENSDFMRAFRKRSTLRLELFPYWYEPSLEHDALLAGLLDHTGANALSPVFALLRLHRAMWERSVHVRGAVLDLICVRLIDQREQTLRNFRWKQSDEYSKAADTACEIYDDFPWNDADWLACISRGRFSGDMLTLPLHGMSAEVRHSVETAFA